MQRLPDRLPVWQHLSVPPEPTETLMRHLSRPLALSFALTFALAPVAALSQSCDHGRSEIKLSCAEGTNWDDTSKRCVPVVGS
jgi:hypothetical protein